jgi:hypothetical protein
LHKYSKHCNQSTQPKVTTELLNWIRTEFGEKIAENLALQQNKDEKTFNDIEVHLFITENFATFNDKLRLLVDDFPSNGENIKELLFKQNDESETLLHYYTQEYKKKSELWEALKKFFSLVCEYFGKETLMDLLLVKNEYGHIFLYYIVLNDEENESVTVLPKILNYLHEIFESDQLIKKILFQKDNNQWTFLHYYAWQSSNVIGLTKTFLKWIRDNIGTDAMEEMIFSKDGLDQTFLTYFISRKDDFNSVKETMDWFKTEFSFDQQALKKIMGFDDDSRKCLLHCFAIEDANGYFLIEILKWIQDEFGAEISNDWILQPNRDGKTFIDLLLFKNENFSTFNEVLRILVDDFRIDQKNFKIVIFQQNEDFETLLHYYTTEYKNKSELCGALKKFLPLVLKHLGKEILMELLLVKNKFGHTFLNYLVLNDIENEASTVLSKILDFLQKIFQNDHRWMKDYLFQKDDNQWTLLHYYAWKSSNVIELTNFFLCWIKDNLGVDAMEEMIFSKSEDGQTFLTYLLLNKKESNSIKEIMDLLKTEFSFDQQALKKIMGFDNETHNTLLHCIAGRDANGIFLLEILKWIQDKFGADNSNDWILQRNGDGKTFIDLLLFKNENFSDFIEVLKILVDDFRIDQKNIKILIFQQNEDSETLLHYYTTEYKKKSELCGALKKFLSLVSDHLGKEILMELLLVKNKFGHTFLNYLVLNDVENEAVIVLPKILDFLQKIFQNDHRWMKDFLFQKSENQSTLLHSFA